MKLVDRIIENMLKRHKRKPPQPIQTKGSSVNIDARRSTALAHAKAQVASDVTLSISDLKNETLEMKLWRENNSRVKTEFTLYCYPWLTDDPETIAFDMAWDLGESKAWETTKATRYYMDALHHPEVMLIFSKIMTAHAQRTNRRYTDERELQTPATNCLEFVLFDSRHDAMEVDTSLERGLAGERTLQVCVESKAKVPAIILKNQTLQSLECHTDIEVIIDGTPSWKSATVGLGVPISSMTGRLNAAMEHIADSIKKSAPNPVAATQTT